MRVTLTLHPKKDKDIIDYIKNTDRIYKIKESIRKSIQFDNMIEKALEKGLGSETPKEKEDIIEEEINIVSKDQSKPKLSPDSIEDKLDNMF